MTCDVNTQGPYRQTIFCGASVRSFACSLGWNEQNSQCTIQLAEDPCSSTAGKYVFDENLNRTITNGADPGFTRPTTGSIQYFAMGDNFDFAGIVQSWTQNQDENSYPTYTVNLTDPREILDGCTLIIGQYSGTVNLIANLINVYGYAESFGSSCPVASLDDGTGPGRYGGADLTEEGMPWNTIRTCTLILTSSLIPISNQWSPYGRLMFKGQQFCVDLSDVPAIPNYRIGGGSITLGELIRQVCADSGLDYYVELVCVPFNGASLNIIKIRTASRRRIPDLNQIDSFLSSAVGSRALQKGRELRNDVTASLLAGGPKIEMFQQTYSGEGSDATIWPFWGFDENGNVIIGRGFNDDHNFTVNLSHLGIPGLSTYTISVRELRCALGGLDVWQSYVSTNNPDAQRVLALVPGNAPIFFQSVIDMAKAGKAFFWKDLINDRREAVILANEYMDRVNQITKLDILWDVVMSYATEFYGRKFMVDISSVCVRRDSDTGLLVYSHELTDAGWTDTTVLGITDESNLDVLRADDNRVKPCVCFGHSSQAANFLNLAEIDPETAFVENNRLYMECSVEPEFVFVNRGRFTGLRAVITLPTAIHIRPDDPNVKPVWFKNIIDTVAQQVAGQGQAAAQNIIQRVQSSLADISCSMLMAPEEFPANLPTLAAIPLKSNVQSYGPWGLNISNYSFAIPTGKVHYEQNDDLVPWNYGGTSILNTVGQILASQGVSGMQDMEVGTIEVPGLPLLALGQELQAGAHSLHALQSAAQSRLSFGGTNTNSVGFNRGMWQGTAGPNVTSIDCQIGEEGITTTYRMRTYTPALGLFARQNADRLRRTGQVASKLRRKLRFRNRRPQPIGLGLRNRGSRLLQERGKAIEQIHSPHGMFIGQVKASADGTKRTHVQTQHPGEMMAEMQNYTNKYFMSLDGLIRPFGIVTDGLVGGFEKFGPGVFGRHPLPSVPPTIGDNYDDMPITSWTLNPLLGPQTYKPVYPFGGNGTGHDIEAVGRDVSIPAQLSQQKGNGSYPANYIYRGMALRGPLVITGWGYDLDGKPVPNGGTGDDKNDLFATDWLKHPEQWKTGPVDLRWDAARGVWTSWPGFKLVKCTICEDIEAEKEGTGRVIGETVRKNKTGEITENKCGKFKGGNIVKIHNFWKKRVNKDDTVICYYDTTTKKYWILTAASSSMNIRYAKLQSNVTTGSSGGAHLMEWDEDEEEFSVPEEDSEFVTVYDHMNMMFGISEEKVPVYLDTETSHWQPACQFGLIRHGKTAQTLSEGGSCDVNIWSYFGAAETDKQLAVTAYDWLMKAGATSISSGKKCIIQYDQAREGWYFLEIECP